MINYPSINDDYKTFKKNISRIALNVLYVKKYLVPTLSCSKIIIIFIIKRNNIKKCWWFFLLEFSWFFRAKKKLESHKKVCENEGFCGVAMPSKDTEKLEFNPKQKSDIIYADLETLIKRIVGGKNNSEKWSTAS